MSISTCYSNHHSPSSNDLASARQALRQQMRAARLSLSEAEQEQAAYSVCDQAIAYLADKSCETVACYLPFQGEISPLPLMQALSERGVRCVLPRLHPFSHHYLQFMHYRGQRDLCLNRFGILEPKADVRQLVPLEEVDVIFIPLVACDPHGNRLGMGGGFYDRTLAHMPHSLKIGLAHCIQQVPQLPVAPWDMPLDVILLG